MNGSDTVGSLLADIANALSEALRLFRFADKRHWGEDEEEQVHALKDALDQAKTDFQQMGPLVNGSVYYERDGRTESLAELRELRTQFEKLAATFKDWLRTGGLVNSVWAYETTVFSRDLHRAQCRAAARVFAASQDHFGTGHRCLGAFLVRRQQRRLQKEEEEEEEEKRRRQHRRQNGRQKNLSISGIEGAGKRGSPWEHFRQSNKSVQIAGPNVDLEQGTGLGAGDQDGNKRAPRRRQSLEELVPCCNAIGKFQRYGPRDVAFVCDYCDGFLVWGDLKDMPATRESPSEPGMSWPGSNAPPQSQQVVSPANPNTDVPRRRRPPPNPGDGYPRWQALGKPCTAGEKTKEIVFAPLAIANHCAPLPGDFRARILCPYCEEYTYIDQGDAGDGDEGEVRWQQHEGGFGDLESFQEHLAWSHTALNVPLVSTIAGTVTGKKCSVM